jgi:hypothetical protein
MSVVNRQDFYSSGNSFESTLLSPNTPYFPVMSAEQQNAYDSYRDAIVNRRENQQQQQKCSPSPNEINIHVNPRKQLNNKEKEDRSAIFRGIVNVKSNRRGSNEQQQGFEIPINIQLSNEDDNNKSGLTSTLNTSSCSTQRPSVRQRSSKVNEINGPSVSPKQATPTKTKTAIDRSPDSASVSSASLSPSIMSYSSASSLSNQNQNQNNNKNNMPSSIDIEIYNTSYNLSMMPRRKNSINDRLDQQTKPFSILCTDNVVASTHIDKSSSQLSQLLQTVETTANVKEENEVILFQRIFFSFKLYLIRLKSF